MDDYERNHYYNDQHFCGRRFSMSEANRGASVAAYSLSEKARWLYNNTDPITIYEYDVEDTDAEPDKWGDYPTKTLYAYCGCLGYEAGITLEALNNTLCEFVNSMIQEELDELKSGAEDEDDYDTEEIEKLEQIKNLSEEI